MTRLALRTRVRRSTVVAAAAGMVGLVLAGCGHVLPQLPTATETEFKIALPTALAATSTTFVFSNAGTLTHEVLVFRPSLPENNLAVDADGNLVEDAPGMNKVSDGDNINPGQTQTRAVDLTTPGTYLFVCNLPGHYKAGMYAWVTVK